MKFALEWACRKMNEIINASETQEAVGQEKKNNSLDLPEVYGFVFTEDELCLCDKIAYDAQFLVLRSEGRMYFIPHARVEKMERFDKERYELEKANIEAAAAEIKNKMEGE